jgi:hypothetical protein
VLGELINKHFHRQPTGATFGINEMSLSMSWAVDESGIDELAVDESGIDQSPPL